MTAATGRVFGVKPAGTDDPIPYAFLHPLKASVAPFRHWLMGVDRATGFAVAQVAGVTDLVSLGFSDRDDAAGSADGGAKMIARQQVVSGFSNGTSTDAITATEYAVACWAADNQTVGKLAVVGGVNRSLVGVAFGLDPDNNLPLFYPGPIGWLLGRGAHMADAALAGIFPKVIDAGAATDLAESMIPRQAPLHGKVSAAFLDISGTTLAASGVTDFKTLIISKRDGIGGAAVVVATVDTKTIAFTQWTSVPFVVSGVAGAANLLETDLLTIQETHGGAGAIIPAGALRVVMKVG